MTTQLVLFLLFFGPTVPCKAAPQANNDLRPKIGVELSTGQPKESLNLTVRIENLGLDDISIGRNDVSLFATKPTLDWPLRLWLGTPTKVVTPQGKSNEPPEISDVDPNQPDGLRLKPGQSFLYELNMQQIMTEREWTWSARPGSPKSPIINGSGKRTFEPIALWVEILDKNKWQGGLSSRPIMLYPERYVSNSANDSALDKNRRE